MAVVNNKEQVTSFEDILEKIGGFGRWNWGMMFLSVLRYSLEADKLILTSVICSSTMATFAHLSIVFTGYTPDRVVVTNTSGQQEEVFSSVLYCTVLYCSALYCDVLYCTVLYCTVLNV